MAESITLVLKIENANQDNSKIRSKFTKTLSPKKTNDTEERVKGMLRYSFRKTANVVTQSLNTISNRYYNMTENYLLENEIENVKTVVSNTRSLANSIVSGAKVGGAIAGPWGTVAGAVIGAGANLASNAISYRNKLSGYYSSLNATNAATEWNSRRLGLNDGGRGTEN